MKLALSLVLFVALTLSVSAQSPEKMSYQAIIRAQDNNLVINGKVSLQVIVHQGSAAGTTVYQETHSATTNTNGLISLEIGTGTVFTGTFSGIAWDKGPYFIETRVDPTGGSNYNVVGTTQLLSVPYALHAKTADRVLNTAAATPFKSAVVNFTASRNIASTDIYNIVECTTSGTLTITAGFTTMLVGDTINLEAHNGAVLTIQAGAGVTINYVASGSAIFSSAAGNVRFGLLRKTGANSYIISGQ